jgi:hypothetical protein
MTAAPSQILFASPLTVYCRSIAAPMTRYWRFWRASNVRPFRSLRSDYPLFVTCRNCLRQCRCAHIHRLLMSHKIASSGARADTARLILGLHWHSENDALCRNHGLSSGHLHRLVSPDFGSISLCTERKQCSLTCASSPKLSACTTLFAHGFDLEDHRATV